MPLSLFVKKNNDPFFHCVLLRMMVVMVVMVMVMVVVVKVEQR